MAVCVCVVGVGALSETLEQLGSRQPRVPIIWSRSTPPHPACQSSGSCNPRFRAQPMTSPGPAPLTLRTRSSTPSTARPPTPLHPPPHSLSAPPAQAYDTAHREMMLHTIKNLPITLLFNMLYDNLDIIFICSVLCPSCDCAVTVMCLCCDCDVTVVLFNMFSDNLDIIPAL